MSAVQIDTLEFVEMGLEFDDRSLFAGINFQLPMDSVVLFSGEMGSGRSTVLQILAGLKLPTDGSYRINGESVEKMSFEEFLPFRRRIGYAFDSGGLLNNRTLLENLTLPLLYHRVCDPEAAVEKAMDWLSIFEIDELQGKRPALVSPTVRKLVALIRSVIHEPDVLLLDDPSTALKEEQALRFFDLVERLRSQKKIRHIFLTDLDSKLSVFSGVKTVDVQAHRFYQEGAA